MKYVWLMIKRDPFVEAMVFSSMDCAHEYANHDISRMRCMGYESDPEGQCFSKEKLRKDHYQHISLEWGGVEVDPINLEIRKVKVI